MGDQSSLTSYASPSWSGSIAASKTTEVSDAGGRENAICGKSKTDFLHP